MKITLNNIEDIFKAGKCSTDTMKLKGYEVVQDLLADSSGFGMPSERAYTKDQLIVKVADLVKEHGNLTAKITGVGQFQVWLTLFKKTGVNKTKIVSTNVLMIEDGEKQIIRLYDTDIVAMDNNEIILNSGGYQTKTTSRWINKYLPQGVRLYQKDFDWYIEDSRGGDAIVTAFIDGIIIKR